MNRPKRKRTNSRRAAKARIVRGHGQWVRGHLCIVDNADCDGRIEAHHRKTGTDADAEHRSGGGLKSHDSELVALCQNHHTHRDDSIHMLGSDERFEEAHGLNLKAIAEQFWQASPHGIRARREEEQARLEREGETLRSG